MIREKGLIQDLFKFYNFYWVCFLMNFMGLENMLLRIFEKRGCKGYRRGKVEGK